MNKAISAGNEFTQIGTDLPVELAFFGESAPVSGSPPFSTSQVPPRSAPTSGARSADDSKPKPAYPVPVAMPTQQASRGLRFDFNDGARVFCPEGGEHPWR